MDVARIGFSADTAPLKDAKASLDALVPSAQRAERGVNNFNRAAAGVTAGTGGATAGIKSFGAAAAGAATGTDRLTKAALSTGTAMGTVQRAAVGASAPLNALGGTVKRVGTNFASADAHVEAYKASLAGVPAAAAGATSSLNRLGAAANDNINRLQSTPGNIAAQFQDIGVTAAGGMSPMLIALQQGTQLSAAMAGGLGNLLAGLRQVFSPVTLLTIGLVGLVAAGLQAVDWMKVAEWLLLALADAMEKGAVAAAYLGVVLAIAFAPQIIARIALMTKTIAVGLVGAIHSATMAMIAFAIANPFAAVVIAIGLVIAALYLLHLRFGGVFTDIINMVKDVANAVIGYFANAFNSVIAAAHLTVNTLGDIFNGFTSMLGIDVKVGSVDFSGAMVDTNQDFVGNAASWVSDMAGRGADWLRGIAGGMGGSETEDAAKGRTGQTNAEKYADLVKGIEAEITALRVEAIALGMSETAARQYRNEQRLIAEALSQGITLSAAMRNELMGLATEMTTLQGEVAFREITKAANEQLAATRAASDQIGLYGLELEYARSRQALLNEAIQAGAIGTGQLNDVERERVAILGDIAMQQARLAESDRTREFMADAARGHEQEVFLLQRERQELGLTGTALAAYRYETELLADAKRQSLDLSEGDIAALKQQAAEYAAIRQEIDLTRMRTELFRDAQMGFVTDLLGGLRQGQSAWEAFGNAVMNVADKIFNKLLEVVTSEAFGSFTGQGGGGSGGFFGAIMRGFQMFTGQGPSAALAGDVSATMNANSSIFARGGAFGVERFAHGGAFTNGLYNKPTLFKFAGGAALGEMGEAGPEAVMPLKRGPNGSLGVEVHQSAPVQVVVTTNDDRFDAYVDQRAGAQVDSAAPTIASAGSKMAQRTAAIRGSRRLG